MAEAGAQGDDLQGFLEAAQGDMERVVLFGFAEETVQADLQEVQVVQEGVELGLLVALALVGQGPAEMFGMAGVATSEVTLPLLSAFQRLLDLLAEPRDIPILAPIIQREISYRLLVGDQGARLRQIASAGSQSHQIARAIDWLKGNYTRPMRIDDLARQVNMSTSTFHHHFRALTAMSPLQYQKWLRLNEARRLMLTERPDATAVAFQVGYESPSQFSREYSRLFGAPPLRDINSLRQLVPDERI
jgi:AraC-like DNA-binding protein